VLRTPDVLVIGGGVIGCAVAHAVGGRATTLVVERGALGAEATTAAAGVLAVASGSEMEGPRLEARRASAEAFPRLAAELLDATGIDVEYDRAGVLELCLDEADETALRARVAARRAEGFRVEWLDARALSETARGANPAARGAALFADDGLVHPARLVDALAGAARRSGTPFLVGTEVTAAERSGDRITRVRIGTDWIAPATVVLAAGAWAARVPGVAPPGLDVRPARGQMLALRPPSPPSPHILSYADGYLVPRRDGELLVGATVEHVGFEKAVTPAGLEALLAKVALLAPGLRDTPIVRTWAGLRPWAPDGPIVGRAPDTTNLILACGHHRNGILLAPHTARAVSRLLDDTA